jgi:hypothetical protein
VIAMPAFRFFDPWAPLENATAVARTAKPAKPRPGAAVPGSRAALAELAALAGASVDVKNSASRSEAEKEHPTLENAGRQAAAAKVANPAKAETAAPIAVPTLATLAGLAGAPGETENRAKASDPEFWRDLFAERTAIRQFDGGYSRAEAERLAWGELQNRWHIAHAERVPRHLCAACRRPIVGPALDLIDGNRVHDADGHECLIRYGERWRGAATRALVAMGLRPPADSE